MQDPDYKRLFSFPRMVEDLLRAFLPGDWLVRCETGNELLARVDPAPDGANRHGSRGNSHGD